MHVGRREVGTPGDHQVGMNDRLGIGAADRSDRDVPDTSQQVSHTVPACRRELPEGMEQAVHQAAVHQVPDGRVGVTEQRQRAAFGDDRLPFGGDLVQRLVPADRLELARALGPTRRSGVRIPFRRIHQIGVAVHLAAGKAGAV